MGIPHSPADLSSSWLTIALQHGHVIGTGAVGEFECSPLEAGKGFYGQIVRLKLIFDDAMYDYRISLLHRFGALISTIAAMPFTKEQIRLHVDVLLPRTIAAILDHDAGSLLGRSR